jgi:hypothetical protein
MKNCVKSLAGDSGEAFKMDLVLALLVLDGAPVPR